MKKFIVLSAFLLLLGCNSVARLEKQWIGKDQNVLFAVRGTPDETMSDGFGGQIYTYIQLRSTTVSAGISYPYYRGPYRRWPYRHRGAYYFHPHDTVTRKTKTMFWIDPLGKIYKVSLSN
ncbi:MAG: hypothetical protein ACYS1A_13425 [Planctomycetota bacterium]|jgi:hypothetical protein